MAPLYLLACIVFGGSDRASWSDAILDVTGLIVIAFAAAAPTPEPLTRHAKQFLFFAMTAVAVIALQEVRFASLPWGHWSTISAAGPNAMKSAGISYGDRLTSVHRLTAVLAFLPPIASFCAVVRLGPVRRSSLVVALLAAAFVAIAASVIQFGAVAGLPTYPDRESSFSSVIGLSRSPDHLADLLIITLPFIAAIAPSTKPQETERQSGLFLISAGLAGVIFFGLALAGSPVGSLLALPVIAASSLIVLPSRSRLRKPAALLAALLVFGAIAALTTNAQFGGSLGWISSRSVEPRRAQPMMLAKAIANQLPWGSGLASFARVYPHYGDKRGPAGTDFTHANNDYAETALELGLPGIALMLVFLIWWGKGLWSIWRTGGGSAFSRAASIASGTILVESLVDFPLRTAAISACFATFIALLAEPRYRPLPKLADVRPARHLVFE
ncbi:MAG TPA: O-antigen ligase family protein [Sphingomicrobium sp.]|nr:O-antigen ligase family protein [Sphingomicrobium sp.]